MKLRLFGLLGLAALFSACAHLPNDDEKTALRGQQAELKKIENVMYNGKETGLYDQLKVCSMQLHDRVNPEVAFEWTEAVEQHSDKDYFADPDVEVSRLQYTLLVEKYKIFKQVSLARKENYESRLKVCQSDLKAAMRREKIRSQQEEALLDKLSTAEKASRQPAAVVAAPAAVTPTPEPDAPAKIAGPSLEEELDKEPEHKIAAPHSAMPRKLDAKELMN